MTDADAVRADARRQAITTLRVAEAVAGYAAARLAGELGPGAAAAAALSVADELAVICLVLRRVAGVLDAGDRRVLALALVEGGMSRAQAAEYLGVSQSAVRGYLRSRRPVPVPVPARSCG